MLRVKTSLPSGAKIVLDHFETLDQHGNYFNNIMMAEKIGRTHIEVDIPCNTTAVVNLPDGSSYKIGSGPYTFDCDVKQ